jgi:hypothetical protein
MNFHFPNNAGGGQDARPTKIRLVGRRSSPPTGNDGGQNARPTNGIMNSEWCGPPTYHFRHCRAAIFAADKLFHHT